MGIFSSLFGSSDLKKAEKKAFKAEKEATDTAKASYTPYDELGQNALAKLRDAIGLGDSQAAMDAFRASPEYRLKYDAALKAGLEGVNARATAGGMNNSGAALKALQDRAGEITDRSYDDYLKPISGATDVGLGVRNTLADLTIGLGDKKAAMKRNIGQINAGKWAGFDGLLGGAFKLAGGFAGNPLQTLSERTGFASSLY